MSTPQEERLYADIAALKREESRLRALLKEATGDFMSWEYWRDRARVAEAAASAPPTAWRDANLDREAFIKHSRKLETDNLAMLEALRTVPILFPDRDTDENWKLRLRATLKANPDFGVYFDALVKWREKYAPFFAREIFSDITDRLEVESAEWLKCEEAIDQAASIRVAKLLAEASVEINRLRKTQAPER